MSCIPFRKGKSKINNASHVFVNRHILTDACENQRLILFPHTTACSQPALFVSNLCRVFVLADPEVFSGSLAQVLLGDIEASASASGGFLSPLDHMRSVVQHSIQAALGAEQCNGSKLAQALKVNHAVLFACAHSLLSLFSSPFTFLVYCISVILLVVTAFIFVCLPCLSSLLNNPSLDSQYLQR